MTWAQAPDRERAPSPGAVSFADPRTRDEILTEARHGALLVVELARPGPALRGRLALVIEGAIEEALERRGAAPPGVGAASDLDASLSDQLYRARRVGARGLALALASLEGVCNVSGSLDPEDSAVLRWWLACAGERPVRIILDENDRSIGIYSAPVSLQTLIEPHGRPSHRRPRLVPSPHVAPEVQASVSAMQASPPSNPESDAELAELVASLLPPEVAPTSDAPSEPDSPSEMDVPSETRLPIPTVPDEPALAAREPIEPEAAQPEPAEPAAQPEPIFAEDEPTQAEPAIFSAFASEPLEPEPTQPIALLAPPELAKFQLAHLQVALVEPPPASEVESARVEPAYVEPDEVESSPVEPDEVESSLVELAQVEPVRSLAILAASTRARTEAAVLEPAQPEPMQPIVAAAPEPVEREPELSPEPAPVESRQPPTTVQRPQPKKLDEAARAQCEIWLHELNTARGPKPLATIERMFTSCYVPLSEAVSAGFDSDEAREVLGTWSDSFAKSYSEAFEALKVRGKRPSMVLDVPEIALRIGRLHGARSVQLVLVDGMRFDVGLKVQDRLKAMLGQRAALTERLLLWSALPSTTAVQLQLIGRGPEGLREISTAPELETPVARGRAAATLRRMRAGHRELLKLDVVEAALTEPGPALGERLAQIADETADALASHMLRLPPRTLVLTFGDHGFVLDGLDTGTSIGRRGGASPEEVLVPAFAWLVGSVH